MEREVVLEWCSRICIIFLNRIKDMMKFFLGLSSLIIPLSMGIFYYCFCKKTANGFVHKYIEGRDEMKKEE